MPMRATGRFLAAKRAIEAAYPGTVVEGNANGRPRASAFEITVDGQVVFSKLASKRFPSSEDEIKTAIDAVVGGGGGEKSS